ncbi:MAG: ATP-binding cassette domain-containing protein [Clostridia bacterium]
MQTTQTLEKDAFLALRGLTKTYHVSATQHTTIFDGLNLFIAEHAYVTLIGGNGSGKSSLFNLICGTVAPDSGTVWLGGQDLTHVREHVRAARIGRVFQDPQSGTCPSMTVLENLAVADNKGQRYDLRRGVNSARIALYRDELAQLGLGLEDKLQQPVCQLSGGQRQVIALLMATLVRPDLLLLDEHTAALDPKTGDMVMQATERIVREKKITTLMITHNMPYAMQYGDRLLMLAKGRMILDAEGEARAALDEGP